VNADEALQLRGEAGEGCGSSGDDDLADAERARLMLVELERGDELAREGLHLTANGVDIKPTPDGGYHLQALEQPPEPATLDDKLRSYVKKSIVGLQSKLNDVVRVFQNIITGFIRGIFLFFFTLMIGAFILIDLDKVHAFLRSLFPANVRDDYDDVTD